MLRKATGKIVLEKAGVTKVAKKPKLMMRFCQVCHKRESRCKRVLGASEKCRAASSGVEIGITQRAGHMGYIDY